MSSSPESRDDPTERLWARQAIDAPAVPYAAALTGLDERVLRDAVVLSLAGSAEALELLDGMELRVRTLTTTVSTEAVRCVSSVRGPVLWSETITARANALGNDDVFVCSTSERSFDTVENRVLAASLDMLASARRALGGPAGEQLRDEDRERAAAVAADAARWRSNPRLRDVRGGRLSPRDRARLRSGHRSARMRPVLALLERLRSPFVPEDLSGLSDEWTRAVHRFVDEVVAELQRASLISGALSCSDGGLWSGALSWRHPATHGGTPPGLTYRGVALLPSLELYRGAPWSRQMPEEGVRLSAATDLMRMLERSSGAAGQRSRSSASSSTTGS